MGGAMKTCIYPGCDRPAVPAHALGGPQPAFCDLEEHNALTAHQRRMEMGGEAYRAVFLRVQGDLDLRGRTHPVAFDLDAGDDGRLTGGVRFKQTDWGIKPFTALFGTLKVADEVEVGVDAKLPEG